MKMNVSKTNTFQNTTNFQHLIPQTYRNPNGQPQKKKPPRYVTERKDGFIRQYIIDDDETKRLISEIRDPDADTAPTNTNTANDLMQKLNAQPHLFKK